MTRSKNVEKRKYRLLTCAHCGQHSYNYSAHYLCPHCNQKELCEYVPTPREIEEQCKIFKSLHMVARRNESELTVYRKCDSMGPGVDPMTPPPSPYHLHFRPR